MKKRIAVLVSLVMMISLMSGCGSKPAEPSNPVTSAPATSSPASSAPAVQEVTKPNNWPARDITITVGYAAGGDVDLNARLLGKYLGEMLGVNVAVVNTTGASGVNAIVEVCSAEPDGYSMLFVHNGAYSTEAYGGSPVGLLTDFVPCCGVMTDNTYVMCASSATGFTGYDDFVAYAKANPGELKTVANSASNTWNIMRMLEDGAGIELTKVEGGSSATDRIVSCLAGEQQIVYAAYNLARDYIENGDLVLLGAMAEERSNTFPDIPTLTEQGCPFESCYDYGVYFPADTDQEIVDYVSYCIEQVCEDPDFIAELTKLGPNANYRSADEWIAICEAAKEKIISRG